MTTQEEDRTMATQEEDRTLGIFGGRLYDFCEQGIDKSDSDSAHGMIVDEDGDEADEFLEVAEDGSISSRSISSSPRPGQQPRSHVLPEHGMDASVQDTHVQQRAEVSERHDVGEEIRQDPKEGGGGAPHAGTSAPCPPTGMAQEIPIHSKSSSSTPRRGHPTTSGAVDAWLARVAGSDAAHAHGDDDLDKAEEMRWIEERRRALMEEEVLRLRQIQRMRQAMLEEEERRIEMERRKHRAMMLMEQELRRRRAAEQEEKERRIKQQQLAYNALLERRRLEAALEAQQQGNEMMMMMMPRGCYYTPRPSSCAAHGRRPLSAMASRSRSGIEHWEPASLVALW